MKHDVAETALEKLRTLPEDGVELFTREEVIALREMAVAWRGLAALGWLGRMIKPTLWIVGLAIGLYVAFKGKMGPLIAVLTGAGP